MEQYKIRKDGFKEIRKSIILKSIPFTLISVFFVIGLNYFKSNGAQNQVNVLPLVIPTVLVAIIFSLYLSIKKQQVIYESYRLTFDKDCIKREQHNTPTITILNSDVSVITKNSNGTYTIKGNSSLDVIGIPSQIEDVEKLESALTEIKPFATKTREINLQKFQVLLYLLPISLMALVYISKDKLIVGVSGSILLLIIGFSVVIIQRSKNFDKQTKNAMWWIVLVSLSIIAIMYFKLK